MLGSFHTVRRNNERYKAQRIPQRTGTLSRRFAAQTRRSGAKKCSCLARECFSCAKHCAPDCLKLYACLVKSLMCEKNCFRISWNTHRRNTRIIHHSPRLSPWRETFSMNLISFRQSPCFRCAYNFYDIFYGTDCWIIVVTLKYFYLDSTESRQSPTKTGEKFLRRWAFRWSSKTQAFISLQRCYRLR